MTAAQFAVKQEAVVPGSEPDEALVAKVASGDRRAFAELVHRHSDRHLAFAERVMGNRAAAEDALQNAFIKVWTRAEGFRPEAAKFTTWFYRIVMNQCLDEKRRKTPVALPESYDEEDMSPGALEQIRETQQAAQVKEALQSLPDRQKTALVLTYFQECSNRDAAEIMELNLKAFESLLVRARSGLRKVLADQKEELLG